MHTSCLHTRHVCLNARLARFDCKPSSGPQARIILMHGQQAAKALYTMLDAKKLCISSGTQAITIRMHA